MQTMSSSPADHGAGDPSSSGAHQSSSLQAIRGLIALHGELLEQIACTRSRHRSDDNVDDEPWVEYDTEDIDIATAVTDTHFQLLAMCRETASTLFAQIAEANTAGNPVLLPQLRSQLRETLNVIEEAQRHPGFDWAIRVVSSSAPGTVEGYTLSIATVDDDSVPDDLGNADATGPDPLYGTGQAVQPLSLPLPSSPFAIGDTADLPLVDPPPSAAPDSSRGVWSSSSSETGASHSSDDDVDDEPRADSTHIDIYRDSARNLISQISAARTAGNLDALTQLKTQLRDLDRSFYRSLGK